MTELTNFTPNVVEIAIKAFLAVRKLFVVSGMKKDSKFLFGGGKFLFYSNMFVNILNRNCQTDTLFRT